jgi:hypothetical protein
MTDDGIGGLIGAGITGVIGLGVLGAMSRLAGNIEEPEQRRKRAKPTKHVTEDWNEMMFGNW